MTFDAQQITGNAQPLVDLLSNKRYGLDFYQREYSWEDAQVAELIDDLTSRFLHQYDPAHERQQVASYRPYFLGPIVTTPRDGVRYLVDGQQRITTLSLLFMYLRRFLRENYADDAGALESLIFSSSYGEKTFNLDVDERNDLAPTPGDSDPYRYSGPRYGTRDLRVHERSRPATQQHRHT